MLNAVNALMTSLLGEVLPAWLETDFVLYLVGFAVIGLIINFVISFIR